MRDCLRADRLRPTPHTCSLSLPSALTATIHSSSSEVTDTVQSQTRIGCGCITTLSRYLLRILTCTKSQTCPSLTPMLLVPNACRAFLDAEHGSEACFALLAPSLAAANADLIPRLGAAQAQPNSVRSFTQATAGLSRQRLVPHAIGPHQEVVPRPIRRQLQSSGPGALANSSIL